MRAIFCPAILKFPLYLLILYLASAQDEATPGSGKETFSQIPENLDRKKFSSLVVYWSVHRSQVLCFLLEYQGILGTFLFKNVFFMVSKRGFFCVVSGVSFSFCSFFQFPTHCAWWKLLCCAGESERQTRNAQVNTLGNKRNPWRSLNATFWLFSATFDVKVQIKGFQWCIWGGSRVLWLDPCQVWASAFILKMSCLYLQDVHLSILVMLISSHFAFGNRGWSDGRDGFLPDRFL